MSRPDDEYVELGRQFALFLRRAERFYAALRDERDGLDLDRAAYLLLGRLVRRGPVRLSALAEDVCVDASTISRQVAALEAAGLATRTTDPADRRASLIEATGTGHQVFDRNRQRWLSAVEQLVADWTPAERSQFVALLRRINDTLGGRQAGRGDGTSQ
ncbi:MAG TPA: MarR family transcriptional regulator [Micromonosporaceae bacterium]